MAEKVNNPKKVRKSNFELLRIVAMLMIVFHHIDLIIPNWPVNMEFPKIFAAYSLSSFGKAGVDIFALITGYFMYNKKIKPKRFFRVWFDVDFYGWLTLAIVLILGVSISLKSLITLVFPVIFSLRWYATAYLVLYILLPYINLVIAKINFKRFTSLLLTFTVVLSILPTVKQTVAYSDVMWILFGYLIGSFIAKFNQQISHKLRTVNEIMVAIGSFALILLTVFCVHVVAAKTGHLQHNMNYFFIQNSSFLVLIFSVALFLVFEKIQFQSIFVNNISKLMFGVYLSHAPILKFFLPEYIRKTNLINSGVNFYIYLFIAPIIVFLFFTLIEYIRLKLFSNLLNKLSAKVAASFTKLGRSTFRALFPTEN